MTDDLRRSHSPTIAAFEAALKDHTADPYEGLVDSITLYSATRRLSEHQRDLIVLHYGLGFSTVEAAALLGLEAATVRSHLCQARRRLARLLQAEYSDRADQGGEDVMSSTTCHGKDLVLTSRVQERGVRGCTGNGTSQSRLGQPGLAASRKAGPSGGATARSVRGTSSQRRSPG
ncbi:sigma factor-like helix-turn-helix DNA-binding protein [Streptomyces sp. CoH27]|uniref:sigma factor-like helix-turn-helix DNA-binding protein n=1 Tax=Streptomyces sp. CoH27 TaxID=2875763 RepID=UPI001CD42181|nr:sigma factor-like helix-turn-helix DNA-binding protein [Streptomyces sp. CoH27]